MNTTDSTGAERVGWVSPQGGRSTWGIIWSCFTVFLICSWKCTHLNLPSPEESCAGWHRLLRVPAWPTVPLMRKWRRKLMWMGIMALAPELVVGIALLQLSEAREDLERAGRDRFTLAHAFFANMGGLTLRIYLRGSERLQERPDRSVCITENSETGEEFQAGTAHGSRHGPASVEEARAGSGNTPPITVVCEYGLDLQDLTRLQDLQLAFISEADIQDHSKADAFTKAFALCQSGWIVLQSIARTAQGLAITQLELMTTAFVFCALFAYLFWWYKPFDVEHRHIVMCHASKVIWDGGRGVKKDSNSDFMLPMGVTANDKFSPADDTRVNDFNGRSSDGLLWLLMFTAHDTDLARTILLYLIGAAFSAIHLGAWNWQFPSPVIQHLWRVFGTISVGTSLACIPMVMVRRMNGKKILGKGNKDIFDFLVFGLFLLLFVIYGISRLVLIVLTFYCFTSMPTSVYDDINWLEFLPHFS